MDVLVLRCAVAGRLRLDLTHISAAFRFALIPRTSEVVDIWREPAMVSPGQSRLEVARLSSRPGVSGTPSGTGGKSGGLSSRLLLPPATVRRTVS
jgi:hypothetical protein